jgi:YbbR domain-containing protein
MRRFANQRVLYAVLSLLIATIMWRYVTTAQNPLVVPMTVDLHVRGLSTTEVVVQARTRVRVRLQGPPSALAGITRSAVEAYVDLSGLRPGEHRVPVYVTAPPDVTGAEPEPPEVLVVLDALAQQRLPVEVGLTGTPAQGVTVGRPRVVPDHVVVSGPASQVEQVRRVTVALDITNVRQQVTTSLQVRLEDANGQEVRGLSVDPSVVETILPVREGVITKVVPIVPTIVGQPPAPFTVTSIAINPATVTLSGPGSRLTDVQSVATASVDVTGARKDVVRRAALSLPPGVTPSIREVSVTVHIGHTLLSTILRAVPVRVVGVPPGAVSQVLPTTVEVQVEGPQDLLARLTAQAVTVQVDAAGHRSGEHRLRAQALLPRGITLLAIRPADILVVLRFS